jgi:hypothetical protein
MNSYKVITIIFVMATLFAIGITTFIYLSSFVWEPEPETNYLPIRLTYPDSMFMPMYANSSTICSIKFLLKFNGTLAENSQIQIINATCISHVPYNTSIFVGFPQSIDYYQKDTIGDNTTYTMGWTGTDALIFRDSYNPPDANSRLAPLIYLHEVPVLYPNDIYFPVSGDYSPMIMIRNATPYDNIVVYSYDKIKVHVASAIEVEGLKINDVNLNLTHALFIFSWVGEFVLLFELITRFRDKKDIESNQTVNNIKTAPTPNDTMPTTATKKTSNFSKTPKSEIQNNESKEEITKKKPTKKNTAPK